MKKGLVILFGVMVVFSFFGVARAELTVIGRANLNGSEDIKLIYMDDGPFGPVTFLDYTSPPAYWQQQNEWASSLGENITVTLKSGYTTNIDWKSGWRLPKFDESKINFYGGAFCPGPNEDGTYEYGFGYNMLAGELGYLYYIALGNKGFRDKDCNYPQPGWGLLNTGPFDDFIDEVVGRDNPYYWYETGSIPSYGWRVFNLIRGVDAAGSNDYHALAVHEGEVTYVPPVDIKIDEVYHFRNNRGVNPFGWRTGDGLIFGALNVNPSQGTEVIAIQSGFEILLDNREGSMFEGAIPYISGVSGSWELIATNGTDNVTAYTPDRTSAESMPFVRNIRIAGTASHPSIAWDVPAGSFANRAGVQIYDGATNNLEYTTPNMPITATSLDLSTLNYQFITDHRYLMKIMTESTEDGGVNDPDTTVISRSEVFINVPYSPDNWNDWSGVFLPIRGLDPNPSDGFGAPFVFGIEVLLDVPTRVDPDVAIGYDYAIGEGNPLFKSVTLPEIGDGLFDVYLFDGSHLYLVRKNLQAGERYYFDNPVAQFRVLGIADEDGLDPSDPLAFVTELTFNGNGYFTGTMTPILYLSEIPATIDIKPGGYPNCFNINGHGVIPVAILGLPDFDVMTIDESSLSFAGLAVRVRGNKGPMCHVEDVSGDFTYPEGEPDGYPDLVCQFEDDPILWEAGNGTAKLTGMLVDGTPLIGSDEICVTQEVP